VTQPPDLAKRRFIGCLTAIAIFGLPLAVLYYFAFQKYDFKDSNLRQDYTWNGIQVGTIKRIPKGDPVRFDRYGAIIAYPSNQISEARLLYSGPKSDNPEIPNFNSGNENKVVYSLNDGTKINLDLNSWTNFPKRSESSPFPIE
jgi:hypothetical protein